MALPASIHHAFSNTLSRLGLKAEDATRAYVPAGGPIPLWRLHDTGRCWLQANEAQWSAASGQSHGENCESDGFLGVSRGLMLDPHLSHTSTTFTPHSATSEWRVARGRTYGS